MKRFLFSVIITLLATSLFSQNVASERKLSRHLARVVKTYSHETATNQISGKTQKTICALMTISSGAMADVARQYDIDVIDSISRIYIVNIPISQITTLADDKRVERIEAERMPQPAMDVTPGQINATPIYTGTNLPQAFTGKGVAAGVFDSNFDFTHPAFLDKNGQLRVKYYYDFLWKNDDGTQGHALNTTEEIMEYEHSQHVMETTHGTHVMGIMAGAAVDGQFQGMAPEADIYVADFNSMREDFENPDEQTSAVAVLGFKYIFDRAEADGKPCVINFSSCESITLSRQRILEAEALLALTGPGKIIVAGAGNDGQRMPFMMKTANDKLAGCGIINGLGGGGTIDMDIVTPENQRVRFDFLGMKLSGGGIEGTIMFNTDSIVALNGDTCRLKTNVSLGEIELEIHLSNYEDERGKVIHIDGKMPNLAYLMLCGAICLLSGDSPAWMYGDLFLSPFANVSGVPEYSFAQPGYSIAWPATLDGIISVGATGYKCTFTDIYGNENTDMLSFKPDAWGHITQFSALGPTFDGRIKPTVVAPGMSISAPYNSFYHDFEKEKKNLTGHVRHNGKDYYYMAQSGTSMACPVVAGTIAMWLQANPTLTPQQVEDVIAHTSSQPDASMEYPNNTYGYGQIDAYKGLLYILDTNTNIPTLSTEQPAKVHFTLKDKRLNIAIDQTEQKKIQTNEVHIYTTDGRKVITTTSDKQNFTIDLTQLPKGIYAVQINNGNKNTTGSTLIRLE